MAYSQPYGVSCRGGLNTNLNQLEMLSQPGFATELKNFEVDADGLVSVRARDLETGLAHETRVRVSAGYSEQNVSQMKERLDASGIGAVVAVGVRDSDLPPTIP